MAVIIGAMVIAPMLTLNVSLSLANVAVVVRKFAYYGNDDCLALFPGRVLNTLAVSEIAPESFSL